MSGVTGGSPAAGKSVLDERAKDLPPIPQLSARWTPLAARNFLKFFVQVAKHVSSDVPWCEFDEKPVS